MVFSSKLTLYFLYIWTQLLLYNIVLFYGVHNLNLW
jgi:hypothetical protein